MDRTNNADKLDLSEFGEGASGGSSGASGDDPTSPPKPKKKVRARPKTNAGVKVDGKQVWPESKPALREMHEKLLEVRKRSDFPVDAPQWERAGVLLAYAMKAYPYWLIPAHILAAAMAETSKSSGKYSNSERNLLTNIVNHKADIHEKFGFKVYRTEGHIRAYVDDADCLTYELPRVEGQLSVLERKAAEVSAVGQGKDLPEDVAKRVQKIGQIRTLLLGAGKKNDGGDKNG